MPPSRAENRFRQLQDEAFERVQEQMIREKLIDDITSDLRFTHSVTINFDRDIRWVNAPIGYPFQPEPRSNLADFLKRLHFNLQKIAQGKSKRQIQRQDASQSPEMYAVVEDHTRDLAPTARHLHILVQCPLLHLRKDDVRAATERAAHSIFQCGLTKTGFHVRRLPKDILNRRNIVAYPFKQIARPSDRSEFDALDRVWSVSEFLENRS